MISRHLKLSKNGIKGIYNQIIKVGIFKNSFLIKSRDKMENFDNVIKLAQLNNKSMALNSYVSDMAGIQEKFNKNIKGLGILSELEYKYKSILNSSTLNHISKSIAYQSQFSIPQSAIDTMSSIHKQNEQMVGSVKAVAEALKIYLPNITEINNLHYAISGISKQIALFAVQTQDWTILNDFEEVTEQTLEFTENLTEELDEDQKIKFQVLLTAVLSFLNKYKTHGVSALLIVDIFLRLAGIHQYYDFLKDKPQVAQKSEVNKINAKQDSILYFIQEINKQVKEKNECRITTRVCQVKLKPNNKTTTLAKLPVNFEVVILQINHKWVLISYLDSDDNLPQTGWVMKKYLKIIK